MVKTIASIFISALLLFCISIYEHFKVNRIFGDFRYRLEALYDKTEEKQSTFTDGDSVRIFWTAKKKGTARMGAAHFHRKRRLSIERSDRLFIRGKTRRRASENRSADRNDEKNPRFLRFPLRERILKPAVYPISDARLTP